MIPPGERSGFNDLLAQAVGAGDSVEDLVTQAQRRFQKIRQEVLLGFIEEVAKAGTSFALPTHAVHLVSCEAPLSRGPPKAV